MSVEGDNAREIVVRDFAGIRRDVDGLVQSRQIAFSSIVTSDGSDQKIGDILGGAADVVADFPDVDNTVGFLDKAQEVDQSLAETMRAELERYVDEVHEARMRTSEIAEHVNEVQDEAREAADAAASAQTTANGKNARRRGKTQPDAPEGGWTPGDQWVVENDEGAPVEVRVWNGTEFVPDQFLADEILVLGEDGVIRLKDGVVSAESVAASFYYGREFYGGRFEGGEFIMSNLPPVSVSVPMGDLTNWSARNGATLSVVAGSKIVATPPSGGLGAGAVYLFPEPLAQPAGGRTVIIRTDLQPGPVVVFIKDDQRREIWSGVDSAGQAVFDWTNIEGQIVSVGFGSAPYDPVAGPVECGKIAFSYTVEGAPGVKLWRRATGEAVVETGARGNGLIIQDGFIAASDGESPVRVLTPLITPGNVFATKTLLDVWSTVEGTRAWVTAEAREYIYTGVEWEPVGLPPGSVSEFAGASVPKGYLLCNGAAVSRSTYAALFAAIGTAHGAGNGGTTFNVPDRRGRVGVGVSSDAEFDTLGKKFGTKTHTLTSAQIPNLTAASGGVHSHGIGGLGRIVTTDRVGDFSPRVAPTAVATGTTAAVPAYGAQTTIGSEPATSQVSGHTHVVNSGGGGEHNNIQPSVAMNYIIRT